MIDKEYMRIDNEDMDLSHRIKRMTDHIVDKVRISGEMTYYDEDVMYIINYFLNRSMKQLTATEITFKQHEYIIHKEEIRHLERHITALKEELQNQKEINKEHQKLNGELQVKITQLETENNNLLKIQEKKGVYITREVAPYIKKLNELEIKTDNLICENRKLQEIIKGKSIQELGMSDLYKED